MLDSERKHHALLRDNPRILSEKLELQTFLCRCELNPLLRHVSCLGRVEGRDEIVSCLSVQTQSITKAL